MLIIKDNKNKFYTCDYAISRPTFKVDSETEANLYGCDLQYSKTIQKFEQIVICNILDGQLKWFDSLSDVVIVDLKTNCVYKSKRISSTSNSVDGLTHVVTLLMLTDKCKLTSCES